MGTSQYPTTATIEAVAYEALNVNHPKFQHDTIQAAPVSGVRKYVPSNLYGWGEGSAVIECEAATYNTLVALGQAMAEVTVSLADQLDTSSFDAIITGVEKAAVNTQSPDVVKVAVTFQPTGDVSFSGS